MPSPTRNWSAIGGGLALALVAMAIGWRSTRLAPSADLIQRLPGRDGPLLYLDVARLRTGGLLNKLAGPADAEEADYRAFQQATGFNYRRDLDQAVVAMLSQANYFLLRGRFAWEKLEAYAEASGGKCTLHLCSMAGSSPSRMISFLPLEPGLMGLAVSETDPLAAAILKSTPSNAAQFQVTPTGAVWLFVPPAALGPKLGWPSAVSRTLTALQGAQYAIFAISPTIRLTVEAPFPTPAAATEAAAKLEGGKFRADGTLLRGDWPIPPGWLDAFR